MSSKFSRFIVVIAVTMGATAQAVVPQKYLAVQSPSNLTIQSFTKVIDSRRLAGESLAEIRLERGIQYTRLRQYTRALHDFTVALQLKPDYVAAYINRASAYSRMEQYAKAFNDLAKAGALAPDNLSVYKVRGSINFLLGRFQDAAKDYRQYLAAKPDDMYRMLWLYMSEKNLGSQADSGLGQYAQKVNLLLWPGAIIEMYLGYVSDNDVLRALKKNEERLNAGQLCEAYFYLAQYHLLKGHRAKALEFFGRAVDTKATDYIEYEFSLAYAAKLQN